MAPEIQFSMTYCVRSTYQECCSAFFDEHRCCSDDTDLQSQKIDIYHGINGNVSLDRRRGEITSSLLNQYDSTLGSDKSSRSEITSYDVKKAEQQLQQHITNFKHHLDLVNGNANNNSNGSVGGGGVGGKNDSSDLTGEVKKRKWPTDKAYFLAKEILMTERTFLRDLHILHTSFQPELQPDEIDQLQLLFKSIETMIQHHGMFLRDLEHRLLLWEGRGSLDVHRIDDIMSKNMVVLPLYEEYVDNICDIIECLYDMYENQQHFQQIYKEFEQQKICYIPIGNLVLKPIHRILHYNLIVNKLLEHYSEDNINQEVLQSIYKMLCRLTDKIKIKLPEIENMELMYELQRDINGFDKLVEKNRYLIRQGCMLKHSKRGLQQRMFFLFSDILLYGSKSPVNQTFKILGHVPLRSLLTENSEHNSFIIFGGQRAITVSAGTTAEKILWLAELSKASQEIKTKQHVQLSIGTLKNCSSSEEGLETLGVITAQQSNVGKQPSRSNTVLHVCWHRGATVGLNDHLVAAENQLSGYLLRKFKNSSGWQKLWVVFSSFCLYFYKNYQDEFALASLPLLGYSVGPPSYQDVVQKDFVFKLSFKNHIYFFRAESELTYNRWLEVLRSTTQSQDFKHMMPN